MSNLSAGQMVVLALAIVAAVVVIARPETRRRWRETAPVRRVSIVGLGILTIFVVALVAGVVRL